MKGATDRGFRVGRLGPSRMRASGASEGRESGRASGESAYGLSRVQQSSLLSVCGRSAVCGRLKALHRWCVWIGGDTCRIVSMEDSFSRSV